MKTTAVRRRANSGTSGSAMGYVCVHGQFYQPPRENPWLEAIEAGSNRITGFSLSLPRLE